MEEIFIDGEKTAEIEPETEEIPESDNAELLEIDSIRRRKEGKADDAVTMQTALCMVIAVGLIILNIFKPYIAEGIFSHLKEISADTSRIIPNPIDIIAEYIKNRL